MHRSVWLSVAVITMIVLSAPAFPARGAQASPAPAQPPPSPSVPAAPPKLPWNFDPCGGPQELLYKYGTTACVVVGREALFSAGYVSAKVNGTISISSAVLPKIAGTINGLVRSWPSAQAIVGLGPFTDLQIIPQTYARVDTTAFPLLVSGSTDWKVGLKQRIEFDPLHLTVTSVAVGIQFPSGSPPLRAIAPVYSFDLIGQKSWPSRLALIYDMQVVDAGLVGGGRQVTLSPTVLGAWISPGSSLVAAGAVVLPSGKGIPLLTVEQLFNRHMGIAVLYAGMGASGFTTSEQPDLPFVNAINVNGNVNTVTVTLIGLLGKSGM